MGPTNFVNVISTLKTTHQQNRLLKYADDTYLLIPASNISSTETELQGIATWAASCNLSLNAAKTKEVIFSLPRRQTVYPPELPSIERIKEIVILGVRINDKLGFGPHIAHACTRAKQSFYAIRLLTSHGLSGDRLHEVVRATTLARITYAIPAWSGSLNHEQIARANAIIRKLIRLGYLPSNQPTFEDICKAADQRLFSAILRNPTHVLHNFLPPIKKNSSHNLRPRKHNRILPTFDTKEEKHGFIVRMIYGTV